MTKPARTSLARDRTVGVLLTIAAVVCGYAFFIPLSIGWYFEYPGPRYPVGMFLVPALGTAVGIVLRFRNALRGTRARFLVWIGWALLAFATLIWAVFIRMGLESWRHGPR